MANVEARSKLTNTVVTLADDYLEIERFGGFSQAHRKGTKTIPLRSISAVQLKMPAFLSAGFVQFTIPGGNESTATGRVPIEAARDENSVLFGRLMRPDLPRCEALCRQRSVKPISRPLRRRASALRTS